MTEQLAIQERSIGNNLRPFDFLLRLDRKWRVLAPRLPEEDQNREDQVGIAFQLGTMDFIVPIHQVNEITDVPDVFPVNHMKSWVLGIGNLRGQLVGVFDLGRFFFDKPAVGRMFVVRTSDVLIGMRVDRIYGMRHYWRDQVIDKIPTNVSNTIRKVCQRTIMTTNQNWPIFSVDDFMGLAEVQSAILEESGES